MKKLFSLLSVATFLVAFSVTEVSAQANPGGVEIDQTTGGLICSGTFYPAFQTTTQYINGQVHVFQRLYDLNGTCLDYLIPTSGVTVEDIIRNGVVVGVMRVTKNGIGKLTIVYNPPATGNP